MSIADVTSCLPVCRADTDGEVTEDELISLDELQEEIQGIEDYVQSTDIAAMQSTSLSELIVWIVTENSFPQSCKVTRCNVDVADMLWVIRDRNTCSLLCILARMK